jgi:hypothetical protein
MHPASKLLLPRPWRTDNAAVAPRLIPESRVHLTRQARLLQLRLRERLRMTEPSNEPLWTHALLRPVGAAGERCQQTLDALAHHTATLIPDDTAGFVSEILEPLLRGESGVGGAELAAGFFAERENGGLNEWLSKMPRPNEIMALMIGIAYCVEGTTVEQQGDSEAAWGCAADAARWEGILTGLLAQTAGATAVHAALEDAARQRWPLKEPERDDGLQTLLYQTLKAFRDAGEPRPTPRKVIARWMKERPDLLQDIQPHEVRFIHDDSGKVKIVNLDRLKGRIKRLTK